MTPKLKDHQKSCSHFKGFPNYQSARHRARGNILGWELTNTALTAKRPAATEVKPFPCREELLCIPSVPWDVQSKHATGVFYKSLSEKVFILSVSPLAEWFSHPTELCSEIGIGVSWKSLLSTFNSSFRGPVPSQGIGLLVWCDIKAINKVVRECRPS